jgi:hypothetical protein
VPIPRFSAEAALYQSTRSYPMQYRHNRMHDARIEVAQVFPPYATLYVVDDCPPGYSLEWTTRTVQPCLREVRLCRTEWDPESKEPKWRCTDTMVCVELGAPQVISGWECVLRRFPFRVYEP